MPYNPKHPYTSKTVHIPGSHALPPGVSTTMAWHLAYARKRLETSTRGIESTIHPLTYHLGPSLPGAAPGENAFDEAEIMKMELKEKLVHGGGSGKFEGRVKGLDYLNPYFMHLEVLRRRYEEAGGAIWSEAGRHGKERVPIGGWPSGVQFGMGVKYMPEIAEAGKHIHDSNESSIEEEKADDSRIANEGGVKEKNAVTSLTEPVAGTDEDGDEEDDDRKDLGSDEAKENTGDSNETSETAKEQDSITLQLPELPDFLKPDSLQEQQQTYQQSETQFQPILPAPISITFTQRQSPGPVPIQTSAQQAAPYVQKFPLPAVTPVVTTDPYQLPYSYAVNKRYHATPIHPDYLRQPTDHVAIHGKYLDTYNAAAIVNSRPLAKAIPGTTMTTAGQGMSSSVPMTTSALAAITGLGAIGYENRFGKRNNMQEKFVGTVVGTSGLVSRGNQLAPIRPQSGGFTKANGYGAHEGAGGDSSGDAEHPYYHVGLVPCLTAEDAEKHWFELLRLPRPVGRRGWNHIGRDHLGNFQLGIAPVTNYGDR